MRTTIEIPDEYRARLLEIAARRGEKGFSRLVTEALDLYLDQSRCDEVALARALAAKGSLSEKAASELRNSVRAIREQWR